MVFLSKVHDKIKKLEQNKKYRFFYYCILFQSICGVDWAFISSDLNVLMASYVTQIDYVKNNLTLKVCNSHKNPIIFVCFALKYPFFHFGEILLFYFIMTHVGYLWYTHIRIF
jgi:hypothetical protein